MGHIHSILICKVFNIIPFPPYTFSVPISIIHIFGTWDVEGRLGGKTSSRPKNSRIKSVRVCSWPLQTPLNTLRSHCIVPNTSCCNCRTSYSFSFEVSRGNSRPLVLWCWWQIESRMTRPIGKNSKLISGGNFLNHFSSRSPKLDVNTFTLVCKVVTKRHKLSKMDDFWHHIQFTILHLDFFGVELFRNFHFLNLECE